jgi:hypothetical protein
LFVEASGSLRQWMRKVVIDLIWCFVVKRLVEAFMIVEVEPYLKTRPELRSVGKGPQVEVMVFERPPESFDENIVLHSSAAVHTDGDVVVFQHLGEDLAGKLYALIGVEDLRASIAPDGLLQGLDTKVSLHGVGLWRAE